LQTPKRLFAANPQKQETPPQVGAITEKGSSFHGAESIVCIPGERKLARSYSGGARPESISAEEIKDSRYSERVSPSFPRRTHTCSCALREFIILRRTSILQPADRDIMYLPFATIPTTKGGCTRPWTSPSASSRSL
jgi:hypothetical protein